MPQQKGNPKQQGQSNYDKEVQRPRARPQNRQDPGGLAIQGQIKGQKEDEGGQQQRPHCQGGVPGRLAQGGLPPAEARAGHPVRFGPYAAIGFDQQQPAEKQDINRKIPDVNESQCPQQQGNSPGPIGLFPQPLKAQWAGRQQQVQPETQGQQQERQAQRMGMQVAQKETEKGKLGDGIVQALPVHDGVNNPGSPPPPPAILRKDAAGRAALQSLDAYPLPELRAGPAAQLRQLQNPLQVADYNNQQRRGQSESDGRPTAAPGKADQVVSQAKGRHSGQGGQSSPGQIVAYIRGKADPLQQLHWHCQHKVAEIVVADGMAGQPGVLRRKGRALQDGVEKGKIHRLFGVVDCRKLGNQQTPCQKKRQEQPFDNG